VPVTVEEFYKAGMDTLSLEVECGKQFMKKTIHEEALNRPGLALAGFFQYFANRRIQVVGLSELAYLKSLKPDERKKRVMNVCSKHIPCLVITRNRRASAEIKEAAKKNHIPVLRSSMITSRFINAATIIMENLVAPQTRVQGTMVDILGIGVIIEGAPGIGKSETALTLIERGHSLVSDDVTVLRRDSSGLLLGSAVEITRYHMEIRGLGIVHVPSLFGVAAMRKEMKLDLIIHLHAWDPDIEDDRTGLAPQTREILGADVPCLTLPVAAGRDMAHVIEVAALNQKLKYMGHDAAKELDDKLVEILTRKKM